MARPSHPSLLANSFLLGCTCRPQSSPCSSSATATFIRRASAKSKATPAKKKSTASFSAGSKKGSSSEMGSESKVEALRKYLYGDDASQRRAYDLKRVEALNKVIPDLEVHETIVRAWQLHKRKQREQTQAEMERRYQSMQSAIEELEKTSPRLFQAAAMGPKFSTVRGTQGEEGKRASIEGRIEGLFPRQLPVIR